MVGKWLFWKPNLKTSCFLKKSFPICFSYKTSLDHETETNKFETETKTETINFDTDTDLHLETKTLKGDSQYRNIFL